MVKQSLIAFLMMVFWANIGFAQSPKANQQRSTDLAFMMASGLKVDKKPIALKLVDIQASELEAWVLKVFLLRSLMCQVPTEFAEKSCQQLGEVFELKHQVPTLFSLRQFRWNQRNREIILRTMAGVFEGAQHSLPPELKSDAQKLIIQIADALTTENAAPLIEALAQAKELRAAFVQNQSLSPILPFLDSLAKWLKEMPQLSKQPAEIEMPVEDIAESTSYDRAWAFGCGLSKERNVVCWKNNRLEKFSLPALETELKKVNSLVIRDQLICILGNSGEKVLCYLINAEQKVSLAVSWIAPDRVLRNGLPFSTKPPRAADLRVVGGNQVCFSLQEQTREGSKKRDFCLPTHPREWSYNRVTFAESIPSSSGEKPTDPRLESAQFVPAQELPFWCWLENRKVSCSNSTSNSSPTNWRQKQFTIRGSEGAEEIVSQRHWLCYRKKSSWYCLHIRNPDRYKETVIPGAKVIKHEELFCTTDGKTLRCLEPVESQKKVVIRTFPGFGDDRSSKIYFGPRDVCRWPLDGNSRSLTCITFDGNTWKPFSKNKESYALIEIIVENDRVCASNSLGCAVRPGTPMSDVAVIRDAPIQRSSETRSRVDDFSLDCSYGFCKAHSGYAVSLEMDPNSRPPWKNGSYYCVQQKDRIVCVDTEPYNYFPKIVVW